MAEFIIALDNVTDLFPVSIIGECFLIASSWIDKCPVFQLAGLVKGLGNAHFASSIVYFCILHRGQPFFQHDAFLWIDSLNSRLQRFYRIIPRSAIERKIRHAQVCGGCGLFVCGSLIILQRCRCLAKLFIGSRPLQISCVPGRIQVNGSGELLNSCRCILSDKTAALGIGSIPFFPQISGFCGVRQLLSIRLGWFQVNCGLIVSQRSLIVFPALSHRQPSVSPENICRAPCRISLNCNIQLLLGQSRI